MGTLSLSKFLEIIGKQKIESPQIILEREPDDTAIVQFGVRLASLRTMSRTPVSLESEDKKMQMVFLDESGFTGPNLSDDVQPVFVLATHCIPEDECRALKTRFFAGVQADELKFSLISRRPKQIDMLAALFQELRSKSDQIEFAYAHKRFALLCKTIDWVVEPVMRRDGINLYEEGANIAMANMIHHVVPSLAGEDFYRRLLDCCQAFFFDPKPQSWTAVADCLAEHTGIPPNLKSGTLAETLQLLYFQFLRLTHEEIRHIEKGNLDIPLTLTLAVMAKWRSKFNQEFDLIHDATSAMARQLEVWEIFTSKEAPEALVGRDRRTMQFPIGISHTKLENSHDWVGIQIADLLAGSLQSHLSSVITGTDNPAMKPIWDILGDWTVKVRIWPEMKFTPEELGTTGPVLADSNSYLQTLIKTAKEKTD